MLSQKNDRGVEVWVTYNTGAGPIEFHFNNPYVGANSYHTYQLPGEFISVHDSAAGTSIDGNTSTIDGSNPKFQWTIKQR